MNELVERAKDIANRPGRSILGIAGPPGAGKSTLAELLVDRLGPDLAVLVPMDGFHLADATLGHLGRRAFKGAPDTFDVAGYANLLGRLREQQAASSTPHASIALWKSRSPRAFPSQRTYRS